MSEIDFFREKVEEFMRREAMTPTRFGKVFAGDPLFVFQLRVGREPRTETRRRILNAMRVQEGVN